MDWRGALVIQPVCGNLATIVVSVVVRNDTVARPRPGGSRHAEPLVPRRGESGGRGNAGGSVAGTSRKPSARHGSNAAAAPTDATAATRSLAVHRRWPRSS